ncbi:MAG: hypothetical protein II943_05300 [Victivallales bacterium]|nr:hypothetical protein [Victivallales bacterium]
MEDESNKPKNSLKEFLTARKRGLVLGILLGYMASYFFQPAFITQKLGFWGYLSHFYEILFRLGERVAMTGWLGVLLGGGDRNLD